MNTAWSRPTRYIIAVSLVLLGMLILYLGRSVIPLLILAALIAVLSRPAILWLHRRARLPRGLSVALVYLALAIIVPLALLLAIPALIDAVQYVLGLDYQNLIRRFIEWISSTLNAIKAAPLPVGGVDQYIDQTIDTILAELGRGTVTTEADMPSVTTIIQSLGSALNTTFRTAAGVVGAVGTRVALTLFIFLTSIYISLGAHTYYDAFMRVVPAAYRPEITLLLARLGRMWGAFFRGQITLMIVIGVISWVGLTALGMPGAMYLAIIAGLLELIPNLGPIIATIPAVFVALLQGSYFLPVSNVTFALIIILFYILVQQLENNLIVPRVLGDAVDLPPLVVMSGVLVGAEIGGLLGALLATPITASIREITRYAYYKILGQEPFPPEEADQQRARPRGGLPEWVRRLARRPPKPARPQIPSTGTNPEISSGAKSYPYPPQKK